MRTLRLIIFTLLLILIGAVAIRWYLSTTAFQRILGVPAPDSVTDVHFASGHGFTGGDAWLSARISPADFEGLMGRLALQKDPPILRQYGRALTAYRKPNIDNWWIIGDVPDAQTYFAVRGDGFIAATYREGRVFLRRDWD